MSVAAKFLQSIVLAGVCLFSESRMPQKRWAVKQEWAATTETTLVGFIYRPD